MRDEGPAARAGAGADEARPDADEARLGADEARLCRVAIAAVVVGFALRAALALAVRWKALGDEAEYLRCTRAFLEHGRFGSDLFVRVPGHFAALAALASLFGVDRLPRSAGLLGAAVAAATTWLVFRAGRRAGGARLGAVAAWIHALLPEGIYYAHRLWPDTTLAFWMLLALDLAASGAATRGRAIAAGAACGIALLTKPTGAVVLPVAAVLCALRASARLSSFARGAAALGAGAAGPGATGSGTTSSSTTVRIARAALVVAAAVAVVLPWAARNRAVHGAWMIEDTGAANLMRANAPSARWRKVWLGRPVVERSRAAAAEGLRGIAAEPGRWARRVARSLADLLVRHELLAGRYDRPGLIGPLVWAETPAWAVVIALAVLGLRKTGAGAATAVVALGLVACSLLAGRPRYRVAFDPFFALLAAAGAARLCAARLPGSAPTAGQPWRRALLRLAPEIVLLALLALLCAARWPPWPASDPVVSVPARAARSDPGHADHALGSAGSKARLANGDAASPRPPAPHVGGDRGGHRGVTCLGGAFRTPATPRPRAGGCYACGDCEVCSF